MSRDDRIARGQCPDCGKEAAPYYLCFDCRFKQRLVRGMKRGERLGVFASEMRDKQRYWKIGANDTPDSCAELSKWGTPIVLPETDQRGHARLRGIRVDIEATLIEVLRFLDRPCTIEEILGVWGSLRAKRSTPLAIDLARLIKAEDRRSQKAAKRLREAQSKECVASI